MTQIKKINGIPVVDTTVTGFTYDSLNQFTISTSDGNTYIAAIDVLSATTISATSVTSDTMSATTMSATTFYGDGSNLTGISGAGEVNTASNLAATGIFAQKNGVDLEFKGLTSTGATVTITSNGTTVNLESSGGGGGSSRISSSVATTNATPTELEKINTISDNTTNIIEVYITVKDAADVEYGAWKRTLVVTKFNGTVVIRQENADLDVQSSNFIPTPIEFNINVGDIDVDVTGIAATNLQWDSEYEIISSSTN